jgi:hypothetical protein
MDKQSVKVFSATKHNERNALGEQITRWLNQEPEKDVHRVETLQSSDSEFHCLSIIYFYSVQA